MADLYVMGLRLTRVSVTDAAGAAGVAGMEGVGPTAGEGGMADEEVEAIVADRF